MAYVQTAARRSQTALIVSPRLRASTPKAAAPRAEISPQTRRGTTVFIGAEVYDMVGRGSNPKLDWPFGAAVGASYNMGDLRRTRAVHLGSSFSLPGAGKRRAAGCTLSSR